ncbi:hypothetical protein [Actinospongicola halichondriae]|uniref:hypothetical protein n=1 Tax=Actinospongicola halichondriae TaxID=3236844 RepID=UPI003D41FA7E
MTARRLVRGIAARLAPAHTSAMPATRTHGATATHRLVTCPVRTPSLTLATARIRANT